MKYITVKQLYEKLNSEQPWLIGINSVYTLVKRKDFPSVRNGRKFLIIEDKVDEWFEKRTVEVSHTVVYVKNRKIELSLI